MFGTLRCRSRSDPDRRALVVPFLTRVQEAPSADLVALQDTRKGRWAPGSVSARVAHLAVLHWAKDPQRGLKSRAALSQALAAGPRDPPLLMSHNGRTE